ncbi:MAG: LPS export ABC transporter periplasmic protein LptC [Sphingosinicella sp.]
MSELADQERLARRAWAAPGSAHDRTIHLMKIALPGAIAVIILFLAFSPLGQSQDPSFLLDKSKVEQAEERMRVEMAQYRGQDNRGRPFLLTARSALQQSSAVPVVDIRGMSAQIQLDDGPARVVADRGRYDMSTDQVDIVGPVRVAAADGYRLDTSDVSVDLRSQRLASRGPVAGAMPLGRFAAGRMQASLPDRKVVLDGRARLHIVQTGRR